MTAIHNLIDNFCQLQKETLNTLTTEKNVHYFYKRYFLTFTNVFILSSKCEVKRGGNKSHYGMKYCLF